MNAIYINNWNAKVAHHLMQRSDFILIDKCLNILTVLNNVINARVVVLDNREPVKYTCNIEFIILRHIFEIRK